MKQIILMMAFIGISGNTNIFGGAKVTAVNNVTSENCSLEVNYNSANIRREISSLKLKYHLLKQKQLSTDPTILNVTRQNEAISKEIEKSGQTDSLMTIVQSNYKKIGEQKKKIRDSDEMKLLLQKIKNKKLESASIKNQINKACKETSK